MKAIFSLYVPNIKNMVKTLKENGFDKVFLKVADGAYKYRASTSLWPGWGENVKPELVEELIENGISVWGWGFNYGYEGEIKVAIDQVKALKLDGYIYDVESIFDAVPGAGKMAWKFGSDFKNALPNTPLAFCSWSLYRNPTSGSQWHNIDVGVNLMHWADYGMPMIYWGGTTPENVLWWLENSHKQWTQLFPKKPLIATGRAYYGDGSGAPSHENIKTFAARALELGYSGLSWWFLDHADRYSEIMGALREVNGATMPVIEPIIEPVEFPVSEMVFAPLSGMNVRSSPTTWLANVIGSVGAGERLSVLEIGGNDCWIKTQKGWVCKSLNGREYLKEITNVE